jgi:hypothetical protein
MKGRLALPLIVAPLTLTACNSVPVGLGNPSATEFASSSSITIKYDPLLTSLGEIQNTAQKHCDQYGKDAIPQAVMPSGPGGVLGNASFICKPRT